MNPPPKCLLLPIDGTRESLNPMDFLKRLYPRLDRITLILCYFLSPLPPIYKEKPDSDRMMKKRHELLRSRETETRAIMREARRLLREAGFTDEHVHEHVQERELSISQHACLLAGMRKVDALIVQKRTSVSLEGLIKEDPSHELLHHCHLIPVWLTEGKIDPSRAAICIQNEETSLRAADHGAFMLAETDTQITLLHATKSVMRPVSRPLSDPGEQITTWMESSAGKEMEPFLEGAGKILKDAGVGEERIQLALIPNRGDAAHEILSYCREQGIGIVVIGHSSPTGKWAFLKKSVTKKALAEFKNMAIWVNQ